MGIEWRYVFDDREATVESFIVSWRANMEALQERGEKAVVVMDITETKVFTVQKAMKLVAFICSHRRKLSSVTEKVSIIVSTDKQRRGIKTALGMCPARICEFEVIKNVADV